MKLGRPNPLLITGRGSVVVGTSQRIDVLANDTDPDGDTLFLVAVPVLAGVYQRSVMREKNARASFLAFAFACLLLLGFAAVLGHALPAVLVACPLAVVLSYPLQVTRRLWLAELAVYALLVAAVAGPWWG